MDLLTLHARQARRDWTAHDQLLRGRRPPAPLSHDGGSRIVSALEDLYQAIRCHHPELPDVVIITGSGNRDGRSAIGSPCWCRELDGTR